MHFKSKDQEERFSRGRDDTRAEKIEMSFGQ